ncbi:MAG: hypothetical protein HY093_01205 [Candidatus Liptonbacteria bacterium]|nr:hypothetical protein [Candidatus Liptonbacteria bacterium]
MACSRTLCTFSNLSIPPERDGFGWLIVAAAGLTLNQVFTKCAERMRAWRWTENLDKATPQNDRVPKTDYCLWARVAPTATFRAWAGARMTGWAWIGSALPIMVAASGLVLWFPLNPLVLFLFHFPSNPIWFEGKIFVYNNDWLIQPVPPSMRYNIR